MLPQQQLFHRAWRTPHGPTQHASEFEQQWGFCVDGRETMHQTGSPLQGEDLGGRRRSDGEGQLDEESNPLVRAAVSSRDGRDHHAGYE